MQTDKVQPGLARTIPRSCSGSPPRQTPANRSAESGVYPVHQITFATSRLTPVREDRLASFRRPLGHALTPPVLRFFAWTESAAASRQAARPHLSSEGSVHGQDAVEDAAEDERPEEMRADPAADAEGNVAGVAAGEPRRCDRATSTAISAPELPAPTRRTPPSRNWPGLGTRASEAGRCRGQRLGERGGLRGL